MTISSPDTISTTLIQDGQAAGSITPSDLRVVTDSLAGVYAPAAKTSTPYVLTLADRGTCIDMNLAGANAVNVPTDASVAFDNGTLIEGCQYGAGQTTIQAVTPGTTTIRSATGTFTTRAQYSGWSLRKRAANEWLLSGDLT